MKSAQRIIVPLMPVIAMLFGAPVFAQGAIQVVYWQGGQGQEWAVPLNWSGGFVPDGNYGASIGPSPPGLAGPNISDARSVGGVGLDHNSLGILSTGSLTTGLLLSQVGSQISVSGSLTAQSIDNRGSFSVLYNGALTIDRGAGGPSYLSNSGSLFLGGTLSLPDGIEFSNSGTLTLASRVNIPASVNFSNTGNLNLGGTLTLADNATFSGTVNLQGGTLNLPANTVLSNTSGVLNEFAGGTINGGVVTIDGSAGGATEWQGYGMLNARVLTLSGTVLADRGTLSIVANDLASNSFQLGALAGSPGNTLSITSAGGSGLLNTGQIYAARVPGSPAGNEGVLELVGNAAGTPVLNNQGRTFAAGGVQIYGALAVRNPSGGKVLVQNDGDFFFAQGSRMNIEAGSNFVLQGDGRLLLQNVDLAAAAGAGLSLGGQSIFGSGSISFTPIGALGDIAPGDPLRFPPAGAGQLSLIPDSALTASAITVNPTSTLLLDLRSAGSFAISNESFISGQLIVHGPDGADGALFTSDGNLNLAPGGEILLRGARHTIDGMGDLQLQGTILGEQGGESLVLAMNTWSSGSRGVITHLATFENRSALGASGTLTVDAGAIASSGTLRASSGGTVTLIAPVVTNTGSVWVMDTGSTLAVSGELQNSGSVYVGPGAQSTAGTYRQIGTTSDTRVDGLLAAPLIDIQGGWLRGAGTIAGTLQIGPGATFSPGDSPGHLRLLGDYSMSGGGLLIEVAGAQQGISYDWLDVSGAAHLNGGLLHVVFLDGFTPSAGQSFAFLTAAGGIDGTGFSQFAVDGLGSGLKWDVRNGSFEVAAVPEPAAWALMLTGLGLLLGWRGGRRRA